MFAFILLRVDHINHPYLTQTIVFPVCPHTQESSIKIGDFQEAGW